MATFEGGYSRPKYKTPLRPDANSKEGDVVVTAALLQEALDRWEHLNTIRSSITEDQGDLARELKSAGIDMKAFRKLVARRKRNTADIEAEALADDYEAQVQE